MQYLKIPFTGKGERVPGTIYKNSVNSLYFIDSDSQEWLLLVAAPEVAEFEQFIVDDEPVEIPRILQPEPFLPVDEPTPPLVETVGLLEALDGLTKLADAMRSDGVTFPPEPTVLRVPAGIEEGS